MGLMSKGEAFLSWLKHSREATKTIMPFQRRVGRQIQLLPQTFWDRVDVLAPIKDRPKVLGSWIEGGRILSLDPTKKAVALRGTVFHEAGHSEQYKRGARLLRMRERLADFLNELPDFPADPQHLTSATRRAYFYLDPTEIASRLAAKQGLVHETRRIPFTGTSWTIANKRIWRKVEPWAEKMLRLLEERGIPELVYPGEEYRRLMSSHPERLF